MEKTEYTDLSLLAPDERKAYLFSRQKELLDTLLAHNAVTAEQYEKSLSDLARKMGFC